MSDTSYQAILINKNSYGSGRHLLAAGAVLALILVILGIYIVYHTHELEEDDFWQF